MARPRPVDEAAPVHAEAGGDVADDGRDEADHEGKKCR